MGRSFDLLTGSEPLGEDVQVESGWGKSTYGALAERFNHIYKLTLGRTSWSDRFEQRLAAANMSTTADLWLSGASAIGMIGGGLIGLIFLAVAISGLLPIPVLDISLEFIPYQSIGGVEKVIPVFSFLLVVMFYMGVGATLGILLLGGVAITIPYIRAKRRDRKIGIVQPDAVGFMHSLAASGINQMEVFRSVARSEDVYGEYSVEYQRIIHQIETFNKDFDTAVQEVAQTTPNDDLRKFLTSLLSTIGAGGSLSQHLEDAKRRERENRERQLESIVDYIMILGQSYMTLMILPMLLVIVLVIMALIGKPNFAMLAMSVYFLIPIINIIYAIMISSIVVDEVGDGYMRDEEGNIPGMVDSSPWDFNIVENYLGNDPVFQHIAKKEAEQRVKHYVLQNPFTFFVRFPGYIFALTVPITLIGWAAMYVGGVIEPSYAGMEADPLGQTVAWFFWPICVNLIPFTIFYEYRERTLAGIMDTVAEDFRALANINNKGQPLPESMQIVSENSESKLAHEFGIMYKKLQMNIPMGMSIIEMNNKYHIPRLARQLKILEKAQEVSTHIGDVLNTAAETAEYQHRIAAKRQAKMNTQLVIIEGAFLVFLLIMVGMDVAFVGFASEVVGGAEELLDGSGQADPLVMKMMFLHAALIQGFASGLLAGYIKHNDVARGVKIALFNSLLVIGLWVVAPIIANIV